jgi:putative integral membrane protein (TIGR02587 family)
MATKTSTRRKAARDAAGEDGARDRTRERQFAVAIARAFGGAIIFSLPILMTMEMWYLGFYMEPLKLALLLVVIIPLLVGLSYFSGFEETTRRMEDVLDAFVAYAVGFVASAALLLLFAVIGPGMTFNEIVGKISVQAVPASIGAILAQSQLGVNRKEEERKKRESGYVGELFFMTIGALFLGFNLAPTEEMILIGYRISEWHALGLALVSLAVLHGFVYAMEFQGQAIAEPGTPFWSLFLRFTVVGYAIALLISAYILWTFGRIDGTSPGEMLMAIVVLAFPSSLGAAAARLIL